MQDQSLRSVVSSFFFQMILFLQGASHAGKTTFAKHLARLTGASVVSLDLLKEIPQESPVFIQGRNAALKPRRYFFERQATNR